MIHKPLYILYMYAYLPTFDNQKLIRTLSLIANVSATPSETLTDRLPGQLQQNYSYTDLKQF